MLVELAAAPAAAGLFFMYVKDKYEKEPWRMLLLGLLFGLYTAAVIYPLGRWLEWRFPHEETPLYTAFLSSAGVEEGVRRAVKEQFDFSNKDAQDTQNGEQEQ